MRADQSVKVAWDLPSPVSFPDSTLIAKHGSCAMSVVRRLYPVDEALRAAHLDDESLPIAPPPGGEMELCPHCGVENGITASVCWSCDAELPAAGAVRPEAGRGPDADSRYPVLTQVVEGNVPTTALEAPGAVPQRRTREIVAAAIVLSALLAAAAYVYFPTSRNVLPPSLSRDTAVAPGGAVGGRELVAPTKADPAYSGSAQSTQSAVSDALAAAARALAIKPNASTAVGAAAVAAPATNNPVAAAARPKATAPATAGALANAQRGKARRTLNSANAPATVPAPGRREPTRQASEQLGPCTATIAALGLCAGPPAQPKE